MDRITRSRHGPALTWALAATLLGASAVSAGAQAKPDKIEVTQGASMDIQSPGDVISLKLEDLIVDGRNVSDAVAVLSGNKGKLAAAVQDPTDPNDDRAQIKLTFLNKNCSTDLGLSEGIVTLLPKQEGSPVDDAVVLRPVQIGMDCITTVSITSDPQPFPTGPTVNGPREDGTIPEITGKFAGVDSKKVDLEIFAGSDVEPAGVPEPGSLALLLLGLSPAAGILGRRRLRRS